jgi:radical SAM protein with 4Fe4S-binding SPASM domain
MKDWMIVEHHNGHRYLVSAKGFHFLKLIREYYRQNDPKELTSLDELENLVEDPEYKQFVNFLSSIRFLSSGKHEQDNTHADDSDEDDREFDKNDELYNQLVRDAYDTHRPNHVQMEIESLCNFDCKYCVRGGSVPYDVKKMLTISDYRRIFDEFEDIGISEVTFSGGEPFLRSDINDILMLTADYGFKMRIFTNASLITQSNIDVLKLIRYGGIQIGLYGTKEDYPVFTGVDAFDDVWKAMRLLKDNGLSFSLSCPITKINRASFQFFKSLEKDFSMNYNFQISPPRKHLPNDASSDFALDIGDEFLNEIYVPGKAKEVDPNRDDQCVIGHNFICIDIIGNVYPCYNYPIPIGNLHHRDIESIWFDNPELDRLREINSSDVFAECRSCECRTNCVRCMAYNLIFTGNAEKLNPYTCKMGKFVTELNKRKGSAENDKI